eukprot:355016-Chlamydomonas_euryale.AAC.4
MGIQSQAVKSKRKCMHIYMHARTNACKRVHACTAPGTTAPHSNAVNAPGVALTADCVSDKPKRPSFVPRWSKGRARSTAASAGSRRQLGLFGLCTHALSILTKDTGSFVRRSWNAGSCRALEREGTRGLRLRAADAARQHRQLRAAAASPAASSRSRKIPPLDTRPRVVDAPAFACGEAVGARRAGGTQRCAAHARCFSKGLMCGSLGGRRRPNTCNLIVGCV